VQSSVGTVQSALTAWYPPLPPVRKYPDQLLEGEPGNDGGGSVVEVVVVVDVVVDVVVGGTVVVVDVVDVVVVVVGGTVVVVDVVVVVGAVIPASTTFRCSTVLVLPSTVRLSV
jgi:hypothetical protein